METEGGGLFFKSGIDNKQLNAGIDETMRRVQGLSDATVTAGAKIDKVFHNLTSESTNSTAAVSKHFTRQIGLIADIEKELIKLREAKRGAFTIEDIEKYNKKIQEAELNLKEYNEAGKTVAETGKKQVEVNETLTQSVGKWALGLGGAAAMLGILKKALLETTTGLDAFNIIGAATKQVLYNIVTGASDMGAGLGKVIEAQKQLNALRIQEKIDTYEAKKEMIGYNNALVSAHDQTKSVTERIEAYDEALKHHKTATDIEIKSVEDQMRAYKDLLTASPDNEKAKLALLDLRNKVLDLKNSEVSSMKEVASMRSGLIKKEIEDEVKWRKDLHDMLQKAADEEIEIYKSIPEQVKLLNEAVEAGNVTEIKAIAERIKVLQDELDVRTQIAKAALLSAFTEGKGNVTPVKTSNLNISIPFVRPSLPGLQPASANAQVGADLGKERQWNVDNEESLAKQAEIRERIKESVTGLIMQLGEVVGMDEKALAGIGSLLEGLKSGNIIGVATAVVSNLLSLIPNEAAKVRAQIDAINMALREQQRLIEQAARTGGERQAREDYIKGLEEKEKAIIKALNYAAGHGKDTSELLASLLDVRGEIANAKQDLNDFMNGGITENTLADSIAQGFREGKASADDFADYMNKVLTDAVMNIFTSQTLIPLIHEKITPIVADALADGVLTQEEIDKINAATKTVMDLAKQSFDALTQNLNLNGDISQPAGLSGQISRSITEETGSELAGLFRRFADDERVVKDYSRQGVNHLVAIETNTANTVIELQNAVAELKQISSNTSTKYSAPLG